MIYSVFAGAGKTYLSQKYPDIIDLESSFYQWAQADSKKSVEANKGNFQEKNIAWPQNYINEIARLDQLGETILIAAQPAILKLLTKNGLAFETITPEITDHLHYVQRYRERGNTDSFINFMDHHFNQFVHDLDENPDANAHWKIPLGKHLSDMSLFK